MQKLKRFLQKLNENLQKLKDFFQKLNLPELSGPVVFQSGVQKKPVLNVYAYDHVSFSTSHGDA